MRAPEKLTRWMSAQRHTDQFGHIYRYHPRSDAHSAALCRFIIEDLLSRCSSLQEQAARSEVAYGINIRHTWPTTGKSKTLDLAIGQPASLAEAGSENIAEGKSFSGIFFACEAKSVMTEHSKSQPRVYDELSSSHEIVHQGKPEAIAAGVAVVNIASEFASPLRQRNADELVISQHRQPQAAENMVAHLRGLPIREQVGEVGFDAYCTIVIDCNNQDDISLWTGPPAPQPGEPDHYETFLRRIADFYAGRFGGFTG